jgi:molybdate transport repressor ModE-like protein
MSYRYSWNLIEKWAAFFGAPLVEREQGRGTRLTALGEKLVWAGQRLQARLGPQLQNLAQELETELNDACLSGPISCVCTQATGLRCRSCASC